MFKENEIYDNLLKNTYEYATNINWGDDFDIVPELKEIMTAKLCNYPLDKFICDFNINIIRLENRAIRDKITLSDSLKIDYVIHHTKKDRTNSLLIESIKEFNEKYPDKYTGCHIWYSVEEFPVYLKECHVLEQGGYGSTDITIYFDRILSNITESSNAVLILEEMRVFREVFNYYESREHYRLLGRPRKACNKTDQNVEQDSVEQDEYDDYSDIYPLSYYEALCAQKGVNTDKDDN